MMRRPIASLFLALLIAVPAIAPVAVAGEPPSGEIVPNPNPTATTTPEVSPDPTPDPTPDPSAPSASPESSPSPTAAADPTATPAETADPGKPTDPTNIADPADPTDPVPATLAPSKAASRDDTHGRPDPSGRYIVVLKSGADAKAVETRHRQREGTKPMRTFGRAIHGFTATLDSAQRRALTSDPNVLAVVPDEVIELAGQTTPTGVSRVGAKYSSTAAINGVDQRVDADVAIVDTGIAKHPDLNIAGGYNCSTSDHSLWRDKEGHGTHVAGTVAALDNDFGVVGVAPGARLWAVKILNDDGYGLLSWYVCGLDWVLAQRDPNDSSRPLIEAVNMSVTKWGSDDHACGTVNKDILHKAICRVVTGGITVVAAAANDSASASHRVPASYNEVITVSALADTDGKPGGLGGKRCYSWGTYDSDDTFANFSNYGADVDIIAPGKCIWSTLPGTAYGYSSGTSMAAPAVTGAVALYKSTRPKATPAEVKEALQYLGNMGWKTSTDPDGTHEKLLDVSRVAKLGTFNFNDPIAASAAVESGGTVKVPITLRRSANFFERVRLSASGLPAGWTSSFTASSLLGWTADATTLSVTVPAGVKAGTYDVTVNGTNQGRTKTTIVPVTVTNDAPTAFAPTAAPTRGSQVGVTATGSPTTVSLQVSWPAATDPTSAIGGYEVERRIDGGGWQGTTATAATVRSVVFSGLALSSTHRFRVRAKDVLGNWSPWVQSIDYAFTVVGDRSSTLSYAGTWKRAEVTSATNHVRTTSKQAGATVKTTVTGRALTLVMPRSSVRGKFTVTVDGVKVATVDTYYSSSQARRVVWTTAWSTSKSRHISIRVSGTSGRPTVSMDGLIITR
jgi:subtilisin family serine protease